MSEAVSGIRCRALQLCLGLSDDEEVQGNALERESRIELSKTGERVLAREDNKVRRQRHADGNTQTELIKTNPFKQAPYGMIQYWKAMLRSAM
jgi:hypothetical protein